MYMHVCVSTKCSVGLGNGLGYLHWYNVCYL